MSKDSAIHFIAGGLGGACGAAVINPLEVVKTRLQSSKRRYIQTELDASTATSSGRPPNRLPQSGAGGQSCNSATANIRTLNHSRNSWHLQQTSKFMSHANTLPPIHRQLYSIVEKEGVLALWKGFGTTLVGVFPARAIYFGAYSNAKKVLNSVLQPESPGVHMMSAAFAGFCCTTITNPLWMVRTRLQLDNRNVKSKMTISSCVRNVYHEFGIKGFYRGVTASYLGIIETMTHFAIYERLKRSKLLSDYSTKAPGEKYPSLGTGQYFRFMLCASISRMIAAIIGYPHEVLRTRLREEKSKYNGLWRTWRVIVKEETWRALYGGLSVHLMRTVPNTAITMATYELIVLAFLKYTDSPNLVK